MLTFTLKRISNLANVWLIVNNICRSQLQTYFYGIHKHRALQKMKLHPETECYLKRSYFTEDLSFACEYSHIYWSRTLNSWHPKSITLLEAKGNSLAPQIISYQTYFLLGQRTQITLSHIKKPSNNARWPPALLDLPVRRGVAAERTPILFCCVSFFFFLTVSGWL
jgi:hypothetical protein